MFKVLADSVLISSFSYKDINLIITHCQDSNLSVPMTSCVAMGKLLRDPFLRPPLINLLMPKGPTTKYRHIEG